MHDTLTAAASASQMIPETRNYSLVEYLRKPTEAD